MAEEPNETTSLLSEKTDSEKNEEPKPKKGVKLTRRSAHMMEYEIQTNMIKHHLAAQFFSARQFWFFTVPQAMFTMLASILAFVSTTFANSDDHRVVIMNIIVGSLSAVTVFFQTMSGVCHYGTRSAMHEAVTIDLRDLRDDLILMQYKLGSVEERDRQVAAHQNHAADTATEDNVADNDEDSKTEDGKDKKDSTFQPTFEEIQGRYRQILAACKSKTPLDISEAFHGLRSHLEVCWSTPNVASLLKFYGPFFNPTSLGFKAIDCLAAEISSSPLFPIFLPNARKVIGPAMDRFKKVVTEQKTFWVEPKHTTDLEKGSA